jgi:hypothetical protein
LNTDAGNVIGNALLRQDLLDAYTKFVKELNALAITHCTMIESDYNIGTSALYIETTVDVAILQLENLIASVQYAATQAQVRAQEREVGAA